MSSYSEKLRDPRWQKKRLEIFERFGFACARCDNDTEQLHAHHRYYERGRAPWDYPDEALVCLCESCHRRISDAVKTIGGMADEPFILGILESLPKLTDRHETLTVLEFCQHLVDGTPYEFRRDWISVRDFNRLFSNEIPAT